MDVQSQDLITNIQSSDIQLLTVIMAVDSFATILPHKFQSIYTISVTFSMRLLCMCTKILFCILLILK